MPKIMKNPATDLARLLEHSCHGRFRPAEMLRFLLNDMMAAFGVQDTELVPDEAKETISTATALYRRCVAENEPFTDILGPIYMDLGSHGGRAVLGQFFTPQSIADMMAAMTAPAPKRGNAVGLTRVLEPTCGSGVMVMSTMRVIGRQHGWEALRQYSFTLIDLDYYCARMAAVQILANLAVFNLALGEIVVYQGDTIRLGTDSNSMRLLVHGVAKPEPVPAPTPVCAKDEEAVPNSLTV